MVVTQNFVMIIISIWIATISGAFCIGKFFHRPCKEQRQLLQIESLVKAKESGISEEITSKVMGLFLENENKAECFAYLFNAMICFQFEFIFKNINELQEYFLQTGIGFSGKLVDQIMHPDDVDYVRFIFNISKLMIEAEAREGKREAKYCLQTLRRMQEIAHDKNAFIIAMPDEKELNDFIIGIKKIINKLPPLDTN